MTFLHQWFPSSLENKGNLQTLREQILTGLLRTAALMATLLYLFILAVSLRAGNPIITLFISLLYTCMLILAIFRRLPYAVRAHGTLAIIFSAGLLRLFATGLNAEGGLIYLAYVLLVILLFGLRQGIVALGGVLAMFACIGFGMHWSLLPSPGVGAIPNSSKGIDWVLAGLIFTGFAATLGYGIHTLLQGLDSVIQRRDALTEDFEGKYNQLLRQFAEQTQTLDKRTLEFEAASTITLELSQATQMETLLSRTPEMIYSLFGYDHVGIFLLDEKEEYAVLRAANSEAGRNLLTEGYRLRRDEEGIIGYVITTSQPRMTYRINQDADRTSKNFRLTETQSEIALPLKHGDRIIGVLDVQSAEQSAFAQEEISVLQAIADQLTIAIERARRFEQMQTRMVELESTARQFTRQAWQSYMSSRLQAYGYSAESGELTDHAILSPEAEQAIRAGQPIVQTENDVTRSAPVTNVAVPVKLRDQTLGVLNVRFNSPKVSSEMLDLIVAATERMALALETARLLEEIQVRADREHVISDISAKVRGATNIESILQTTALELGRKLGLRDVLVQLQSEEES